MHMRFNNCYNYAMNNRTDTFAQPGQAHDCYFEIDCSSVAHAASCDGVINTCNDDTPYSCIAMVISQEINDYHWYHWHSLSNFWAHKPGGTAARNYDNSNQIILPSQGLDPSNCNRGPYSIFCGYYYAPKDTRLYKVTIIVILLLFILNHIWDLF